MGGVGKVVVVMMLGTCRSPLKDENESERNEKEGHKGTKEVTAALIPDIRKVS
jgi:hypothetical protein